jgi:hypothetical protein
MTSYEQSPQDEGYSEDPLSNASVSLPPPPQWLATIPVQDRTGRPLREQEIYSNQADNSMQNMS